MAKTKTVFYCTECGNETPKWQGRCSACGAWNTVVEQPETPKALARSGIKASRSIGGVRRAHSVTELVTDEEIRFPTGMGELDRVLGGGAVKGSLVLVGGAPGIGKSTLMLQICSKLCEFSKVLYVSGEESEHQLKLRAKRLKVESGNLFVISETSLSDLVESVSVEKPDVLIVDSIQTLYNDSLDSPAGSISQVKDCTMALMQLAKGQGITVFVIGHVNKEGSIAGPKVLEHMVDCVLHFEGDQHTSYRILRAAKNRFGATNEIGVFEMGDRGLVEIPNPSEVVMAERPKNTSGSCAGCVMQGTRPIISEIQSLVAKSVYATGKRTADGFDYNRMCLLIAVLEKRMGLKFYENDVCDKAALKKTPKAIDTPYFTNSIKSSFNLILRSVSLYSICLNASSNKNHIIVNKQFIPPVYQLNNIDNPTVIESFHVTRFSISSYTAANINGSI